MVQIHLPRYSCLLVGMIICVLATRTHCDFAIVEEKDSNPTKKSTCMASSVLASSYHEDEDMAVAMLRRCFDVRFVCQLLLSC